MYKETNFVLRTAVCLAITASFIVPVSAYSQEHALGRILVKSKTNVPQARLNALLGKNNASIVSTIDGLNVHIIRVPKHTEETLVWALSHNPNIEFAELDTLHKLEQTTPNDPYYGSAWHLSKIGAHDAWQMSKGASVTVAVLDTGVDANHPDLKANMLAGFNTVDNSTNSSDIAGHGTRVAGVIGAIANNGIGVAGVAWNVKILPVRVSNQSSGSAYISDLAEAISWASNNGADIANASFAISGSSTIESAAALFRSRGGLLTVAAGNDGNERFFADSPNIISVAATSKGDAKTSWSSYGNFVDVAAPGAGRWTTSKGGAYGAASGTSFSAPLVAAVLALMKSANPALGADELETILENSALDLGASGFDNFYGHGRIDAYQAVLTAMNASGSGGTEEPVIDTVAPSVQMASPGATVSGVVALSASASDDVQLDSLEIYADNKRLASTSNGSLAINWDTSLQSDGDLILKAIATDSSGNRSVKSIAVTIANDVNNNLSNDTIAPSLNIVGITEGQTISSNTNVTINASDDVALSIVNCLIDGSLVSSGNTSISCNINVKKLKRGSHNLTVNATDVAGNKTVSSVSFSVNGVKKGRRKW